MKRAPGVSSESYSREASKITSLDYVSILSLLMQHQPPLFHLETNEAEHQFMMWKHCWNDPLPFLIGLAVKPVILLLPVLFM
jgi:hypothetical protein